MVTEHEGGLNLGCDALVEGCYGHPLPSSPDLYCATTESSDGPSLSPMTIEEPSSSGRDTRSSDDLGILDSNGSANGCQWCVLVGCGDIEKGPSRRLCSSPKQLQRLCHRNRILLFGVMVTLLIVTIVTVIIYQCTVKSDSEIPITFDVTGHEVVVLGRGTIVPDVLRAARNVTADNEAPQLRLFLVQSIEYKLLTLVKKTRFRDAYKGFQIQRLSLNEGAFEYAMTFRCFEDGDEFVRRLQIDLARVVDISSSAVEFSIFKFDTTSLQPGTSETPPNADVTEIPNETIFSPLCEVGHRSKTCYPNVLHHQSQEEAIMAGLANIQLYFSLCSGNIRRFWCSVFAPDCTYGTPLPPCRSLCQAVLTDCPNLRADIEHLLSSDCSSLPDSSETTCTDVRSISPPFDDGSTGSSLKCREVEVEQCRSLGFTSTSRAGNLLGQSAVSSLHWWRMLQVVAENSRCSPHLLTFGCSVFFPRCEDDDLKPNSLLSQPKLLGPCGGDLCLAVKRDCGFFFSLVGMRFLAEINCSRYSPDDEHTSCSDAEVNSESSDYECRDDQFQCDRNQCISAKWICDGKTDCISGKDEEQCAKCPEDSFRCSNGQCISLHRRCDGPIDCYDGDDELHCLRLFTELGTESLVEVYQPITRSWETVCIPSTDTYEISHSLCNIDRFLLLGGNGRERVESSSLVEFLRSRSNCSNHQPTVVNCNYSDCIDGPRLDEIAHLSESSRFGATLADGDWPWAVSLHGGRRNTFYCGGFLVDAEWVVTAAHCVGSLTEDDDWTVIAGQSRRTASPSPSRQQRSVRRLVVFPRYASVKEDDIALVRLDRPVVFSPEVRRLCLTDTRLPRYQPTPGQVCYVAGWGKTTDTDVDYSEELRVRRLTVEAVTHCGEEMSSALADDGRSTVVCTTGRLANDVCKGDSGSAVLCEASEDDGANGRLVLAGIVSRGRECGYPNVSSVQTAIGPFTDWIRHEITSSSSSSSSSSSTSL